MTETATLFVHTPDGKTYPIADCEASVIIQSARDVVGYVTVKEAAEQLKVHEKVVYQLCSERKIKSVRVGRCIRIPAAEIAKIKAR